MKNFQQKQAFILERFIQLKELTSNSQSNSNLKKIVLLKNIYNEQKCIMKVQPKQILQNRQRNVLHEASFFQKLQGHLGVPLMIWSGQDFQCLVLILQELGLSLFDCMKLYCPNKKMRIKDACMIGIQLIDIIKNFHEKDHLHKNITPETFSFGKNQRITKLYANDLMYMKKFRAKNSLNHIQPKQRVKLEFVTPFMSKNILSGKQGSRRDDIVSILYVIIYLIKGKLPWQEDWEEQICLKRQQINEINAKNQVNLVFQMKPKQSEQISAKVQRMRQIQQSIPSQQLCKELPKQIKEILDLAHELQFEEDPQYYRYIALLKKVIFKLKQKNDSLYEWMQSKELLETYLKAEPNFMRLQTLKQKSLESIVYEPFENQVDLEASYQQKLRKNFNPNPGYPPKSNPIQGINYQQNSSQKTKKRTNCQII